MLDGPHHLHRTVTGFVLQKSLFVHTNAMLAGAGAAQRNRALHQLLVELLGLFAQLLEAQRTPVHEQSWAFYVITLSLFAVFAWPGFVWKYFWRKPGL